MKRKHLELFDKNDTKRFIRKSNTFTLRYFFYALKNLFNKKERKRYLEKAKSVKHNKRIDCFPANFLNSGKRVAVYTALFGDYDKIKKIKTKNPLCDYYIFTDQNITSGCDWQLREYQFDKNISNDPILKNRFLKLHPHLLFPEYEYSIYIDATIIIELDIMRLMSRMGDNIIGLFGHHTGIDCSYLEAERVKKAGRAPVEKVDRQMKKYETEGFPSHFGFFENSIIVRKHNDKQCVSIMETWWNELVNETKRDQLSFMYSVWKNSKTIDDISSLGLTFWIEPILSGESHK